MRMHGHGAHDDMSYVPEEMLAEWRDRDPIDRYVERLQAEHGIEDEAIERLRDSGRGRGRGLRGAGAGLADAGSARWPPRASSPSAWEPLGDGAAPWSRWTAGNSNGVAA